jgi:copper homeostasis protein (lipoprotein)
MTLLLLGCAPRADAPGPARPAASRAPAEREAWEGVLPCADCDGIHTLLVLDPGTSRYQLVETYRGTGVPDSVFRTRGEWSATRGTPADSSAVVIRLASRRVPGGRSFRRVSATEIRQLDLEQREIASNLPYSLRRIPLPDSFVTRRSYVLADSGRTVRLRAGEEIVVILPADPASRFRWVWIDTTGAGVSRVSGPRFEPRDASRPDAGGYETFVFRGRDSASGTLRLASRRGAGPPDRVYRLRIRSR